MRKLRTNWEIIELLKIKDALEHNKYQLYLPDRAELKRLMEQELYKQEKERKNE